MPIPWEAVEALAQEAAARAAEIEDASRLPADLLERAHAGGLLRMGLPLDEGGWSATPAECFEASVRVAAGDGSFGWQVAAGAFFHVILAVVANPRFRTEFFEDPRALLGGGTAGAGTATEVADGYEVEGSWTFATGCWDATWLGGLCVERPSERPPVLRFVMVPAERGEVHASWDVVGLRGTASDTVTLPRQAIPAEWTFLYPTPTDVALPTTGAIACYGRGLWPSAAAAAATQLGIARRALDEIGTFARAKRRPFTSGPLVTEQSFQRDFFAAEATWRSAYSAMEHRSIGSGHELSTANPSISRPGFGSD